MRCDAMYLCAVLQPIHVDRALSALTERWRKREISNFEYLMRLNRYAARVVRDLCLRRVCCYVMLSRQRWHLFPLRRSG